MTYFSKTSSLVLLLVIVLRAGHVNAQQSFNNNWQIGLGIGYSNYYGDVSNYRIKGLNNIFKFGAYNKYYVNQPSFSILFQKKLTPTLGIMLQANHVQFGMSDRYRKNNGSFDTEAVHYARSLNFRTNLQDIGMAFTFSPNNGHIGKEDVFFYPSFFAGFGVSKFDVKGDLYDEKGSQYNYLLPGNIMDGDYETNLRDMRTETQTRYRNIEPYVDLGLALNFRVNELVTVALQSDIKYSASDYLDDVSAKYKITYPNAAEQYAARPGYNAVDPLTRRRGDDNGVNDFYINNRIVLNFRLPGKQKERKFSPPVIYSLATPYRYKSRAEVLRKQSMQTRDSLLLAKTDSIKNITREALYYDSITAQKARMQKDDSGLQKQLQSISTELAEIKYLLGSQQYDPAQRQLQYRPDSVKLATVDAVTVNHKSIDSLEQRLAELENKYKDSVALMYDSQGNLVIADTLAYYRQISKLQQRERQLKADSIASLLYQLQVLNDSSRYIRNASAAPASNQTVQNNKKWYQKIFGARKNKKAPVTDRDTTTVYHYTTPKQYYDARAGDIERRISLLRQDSVMPVSVVNDNEALYEIQVNQLRTMLQRNADSIALMQARIKRSNDSAAYYKRVLLSEVENNNVDARASEKWYRELFTSKSKAAKKADAKNARRDSYMQQEQYYDDDAVQMRRRMNEIEQRNRELTREYETVSNFRSSRIPNSYIQPSSPVVIYGDAGGRANYGNNSEIISLRNELERLRSQVNESDQRNAGVDRSLAAAAQVNTDSIPEVVRDSSELLLLRSELNIIRNQLDSLRSNRQVVTVEKTTKVEEKFDPASFPVISVYFKTGAVTLPSDEISKLSPLAQLAIKNVNARIVLKGFTDPVGNPITNKVIAGKRTEYVKKYLSARHGIPPARILVDEPSLSEGGKNKKPNPLDRRVDCRFE